MTKSRRYRITGPEENTWPAGQQSFTMTFRPETDIPANGKLELLLPTNLEAAFITGIFVDGDNILSGAGRIPWQGFRIGIDVPNPTRMPAFSAIQPLRVVFGIDTGPAGAEAVGGQVTPPDRLAQGVQTAIQRGKRQQVIRNVRQLQQASRYIRYVKSRRGRRLRGDDDGLGDDLSPDMLLDLSGDDDGLGADLPPDMLLDLSGDDDDGFGMFDSLEAMDMV